jgi:hypothetical protein
MHCGLCVVGLKMAAQIAPGRTIATCRRVQDPSAFDRLSRPLQGRAAVHCVHVCYTAADYSLLVSFPESDHAPHLHGLRAS